MRIAQVLYRRYPSPVHVGGGDVRFWQDLRSLTTLGHEVHVLVCNPNNERTEDLERLAASVHALRPVERAKTDPRYWLGRSLNPETVALAFPNLSGLQTQAAKWLADIDPDLIWAEEAPAVRVCPEDVPLVHSHLDFMFKLRPVRRQSFAKRLRRPDALTPARLRKLEIDLCRRAAVTMCASQSEADYLHALDIESTYLPVVGETTPTPDFERLSPGRLFLFGNPNTAMRAARQNLQHEIWPIVERQGLRLSWHQLGKLPRPGADPSWPWIEANFTVHGFVPDLGALFLPGDASIMPYPFDTGGRAKFAVSAGYGVINVAYEETFKCASEFTPGQDCLAARSPEHFVELVRDLCSDTAMRRRLAEGSRAVYERHHTMEAQLPHYERILDTALR